MTAREVTQLFHSRAGGNLIALVSLIMLVISGLVTHFTPMCAWSLGGVEGLVLALAAVTASALVMQLTNKRFNILRSDTALTVGLCMVFLASLPSVSAVLYPGVLLLLVMLAGAYMLFTTFGDPAPRRRVFLLFTVLSAMGMTSVCFLYYLPVLLIGCAQMRIFNFRTLLAALLGVVTPPWIVMGSGLVNPEDIELPSLTVPVLNPDSPYVLTVLIVGAVTVVAGVMFTCANLIKVYSYNSQARAMNGFYSVLFLATALLTLIDFNNLTLYLPLLMAMTAYQAAHFFATRRSPRSFVGVLAMIAVYWGINIWYTWYMPVSQ